MKKCFSFVMMIVISLVFFAGCVTELVVPENDVNSPASEGSSAYENPAGGLGTGKGTLKLYLTDAPGDFKELNIVVSRIDGHISVDGEEGEEEEGAWVTLKEWDDGLKVDLLTLENVSLLLGSMELAPNHYTQLRVFLKEEAELVLEGNDGPTGETVRHTLTIPSSANTGIKLNKPFDVVESMITELTLDFDAQKSVIKTGNEKYKMKPVITVLSGNYSPGELPGGTGTVSGNVSYYASTELELIGLGGANIELTGGAYIFANTTTTSGEEDFEGDFSLTNVPAGTYALNVVADGYYNYSEFDVEVMVGVNPPIVIELLPLGISGIVVDSNTLLPIEGADVSVELDGVTTSTDTDALGIFSIERLPIGIYDLTISAAGYELYSDVTPTGGIPVTAEGESDIGTIGLVKLTP